MRLHSRMEETMSKIKAEQVRKKCMRNKCQHWDRNACSIDFQDIYGPCVRDIGLRDLFEKRTDKEK